MDQFTCLPTWNSPALASTSDAGAADSHPFAAVLVPSPFHPPHRPRTTRQARRPSAAATARARANAGFRPRRRLRREIRMAGSLALMVAPLVLGALLLQATPGGASDAPKAIAGARPPAIWLSIEAPGIANEPPVVLPGYLLPDDGTGTEEPAHAGG